MKLKTLVIKVGTSSICDERSFEPKLSNLSLLVETVVQLRSQGHKVVIVSSGAVGTGLRRLQLKKKPKHMSAIQAVAAVGQGRLMALYDTLFGAFDVPIAQILLSRDNLSERSPYLNACNTLQELLTMRAVPIINENDSVSSSEIRFGDNDSLSAIVSGMLHADHLFLLTDVDALYSDNPRTNPNAHKIRIVKNISKLRESIQISAPGSSVGTGGMVTKLIAAELATSAGCSMVISIGSSPHLIPAIIQEIEEYELSVLSGNSAFEPTIGTHFTANVTPQQDRYWWILNGLAPAGTLFVDAGAMKAITRKQKGSLFAAGITRLEGIFNALQCVNIVSNTDGAVVVGKGIVNYSSAEIQRILGAKSKEIPNILGYIETESVIHRDNLAIAGGPEKACKSDATVNTPSLIPDDRFAAATYPSNQVVTSKYTVLNFLPKNLFEQFHGLANFYFVGVVILQWFPEFRQVDFIIPALPIVLILFATAVKDGLEDWKRHASDNDVNQSPAYVLGDWINVNSSNRGLLNIDRYDFGILKSLNYLTYLMRPSRGISRQSKIYPETLTSNDYIPLNRSSMNHMPYPLDGGAPQSSKWILDTWQNITVGDFVFLRNNDRIPTDILIISSGEPDCTCYVETKNLDGETNLKIKKGLKEFSHIASPEDCKKLKFHVAAEPPNTNLYTFSGTVNMRNDQGEEKKIPVGPSGLLLRGCIIRNTRWVIGLVVYTGKDTKIMRNSGPTPSKRSQIDKQINPQVLLNAFILIAMCLICGVISALYSRSYNYEQSIFIGLEVNQFKDPAYDFFLTFFNCLIIFQNIIPIALYISLDVTKSIQSYFISLDLEMYDDEAQTGAVPKSWNLCDNLGQIEYIFSDKTGTLTSNCMDFKKASVNGIRYGKWITPTSEEGGTEDSKRKINLEKSLMIERLQNLNKNASKYLDKSPGFVDAQIPLDITENSIQAQKIKDFFLLLALCHTVLVEKNEANPDIIAYRAQSPDESALVNAAKNMGFVCLDRNENRIELNVMGESRTYTLLNVMEFNSDRKRMSVIAMRPEGDIVLMCKGADSVIYERLNKDASQAIIAETTSHLESFASSGLRTLCLAFRPLSTEEYQEWSQKYSLAQSAIKDREILCNQVADLIERDLILMGATAIEDKLQEGVPEAIALLAKAGIKIWVLTGDKVETAINIGFSCNLLLKSMILIVIQADTSEQTYQQLKNALAEFWDEKGQTKKILQEFALIIDGASLKFALEKSIRSLLLELGCRCKAVLCCRVSPLQKALVVKLVKEGLGAMCLAIGDGANDVSMIQEADIGIGISGKEGLQAVMASDYAISQFRFLSKLLLVHGRWAYIRSSELVLNYFYKNITWLLIIFWYQFYCGVGRFSAGLTLDFTYSMFFNTLFTILPTVLVGIFDQDLNAVTSIKRPQLYMRGIRQEFFNNEQFWIYIAHGTWQSIISFFVVYVHVRDNVFRGGYDYDQTSISTMISFSIIFIINVFGTTNWFSWTIINLFSFSLSMTLWIIYLVIYCSSPGSINNGQLITLFLSPSFYGVFFIVCCICLLPKMTAKYYQQTFYPNDTDILREAQQKKGVVCITAAEQENQHTKDTSKRHQRASSLKEAFNYMKSRLRAEPLNPTIRRGSIVYMRTPDRQGISNTGFAFSQEPGMEDLICSPNISMANLNQLNQPRQPLENLSNTLNTFFGFKTAKRH